MKSRTFFDEGLVSQIEEHLSSGMSPYELAQSWDLNPSSVYRIAQQHGLCQGALGADQLVRAQIAANVPPEVFAWWHDTSYPALRQSAWRMGQKLACRSQAEKRAWWEPLVLEARDKPHTARAIAMTHRVPITMLAEWFHKIIAPREVLLWGFPAIHTVQSDMFQDIDRHHNRFSPTHALGRGKRSVPIDLRLATEIQRHSAVYNYQQS